MDRLQILEAAAPINDAPALERLLAPIPKSEQIRALLGGEFLFQYYDKETRADFWVGSDGTGIHCVSIVDIGLEDAARVRALAESRGRIELNCKAVASLVSEALAVAFDSVN